MKKKIAVFFVAAALIVCAVLAFTACGTDHGSAEGVAKSFVQASAKADIGGMLDCMYFEDESGKEEIEKAFEEEMGAIKISGKVYDVKAEVTKEYTADEVKAIDAFSDKVTVSAAKAVKVTYSCDLKATITVDGNETTVEQKAEGEDMSVVAVEIDGKWYVLMPGL